MFVMWKIERIVILFFALMLAINLAIAGNVAAETFYVDDDGTGDFTTIQAALNNASSEDEIVVKSGTYTENVDVNKTGITIRSESGNPFDTIVQSSNSGDFVFNVAADGVKISGFNITRARGPWCAGIYLQGVKNCSIENNELSNNDHGIYLGNSSNNTLSNNKASNNECGIRLRDSSDNSIYNNYFNNTNNAYFEGTNIDNTWNTTKTAGSNIVGGSYLAGNFWANPDGTVYPEGAEDIDHDSIFDSQYNIEGSGFIDYLPLQEPGPKTITVNNNPRPVADFEFIKAAVNAAHNGDTILVYASTYTENVDVDKTNITIRSESGNPFDTIVRAASSSDDVFNVKADGVKISGFSITGASDGRSGIYLEGAEYCLIEDNELSENDIGIYLTGSSRNTLSNNTANLNNYCGIWLYSSSSNTLSKNTASKNINYSISLSSLNSNTLSKNTASKNINYGIYLSSSSNSNMLENNIASNNDCGIYLDYSDKNTLNDNTANLKNDFGIYLDYSSDNTLNNNHVLDNNDGIFLEHSDENTLTDNTVNSNGRGIYLNSSSNNCIYNNDFNNNNNAFFSGTNPGNIWNTAKTPGSNIIGGSYLGGNFWATPTKNGFSQIHKDKDGDGICDVAYNLGEGNIDYLPLLIPSPLPDTINDPWGVLEYVTENFTISCKYFKPMCSNPPPEVIVNESVSFEVSPPSNVVVYKNVTIQVGEANFSSNESNFKDATIEFRVEKSWENNITNGTINLKRYSEGKWDDLEPPKVGEDESFIYFKAETPGFSLFTICDKEELGGEVRKVESEWKPLENDTENFTISLKYLDTGYSNPPGIIVNESASSEFSAPSDEIVYKNVNIQVGEANFSSNEDNFRNATIEFRVQKSWIQENNINESTIVMRRFSEGKWENLNTSLLTTSKVSNATIEENNISEDKIHLERYSEGIWDYLKTPKVNDYDDYIYFVAETPGFSPFDIFGKVLPDGLTNDVRIFSTAYLLIICLGKFFVSREKDQDKK